ncbi:16817_t:CDS:2 [Cetraspora pellucida]|uniref:16817_t:CDS:1 n=1 Tax=Cetraspora pellucida TaxID=1433469 RepID=A0A9N9FSL8_9GLOM|nr:16817_t:CDS:2 [Cetraspora pellucida]
MVVNFKKGFEKKVFNEHSLQVITITILNLTWAAYGIGQAYEVFSTIKEIQALLECVSEETEEKLLNNDLVEVINTYRHHINMEEMACVALLLLFAVGMAYIAYNLYQQFGWNNYKKIGGDPKLQCAYKNYLTFLMLLKLNLSSILLFIIPTLFLVWFDSCYNSTTIQSILIIHLSITAFVPLLEVIAYKSAAKENRIGMIIFLISWVIVTIDLVVLFVGVSIKLRSIDSFWYSGITLIDKRLNREEVIPPSPNISLPLAIMPINSILDRSEKEDTLDNRWTIDD